jgi:hypothetical protein
MPITGRPEQMEDAVFEEVRPPARALVPLAQQAQYTYTLRPLPRPDPSFMTQLIATAERRRAAPEDAISAYRAPQPHQAGLKTRQTI